MPVCPSHAKSSEYLQEERTALEACLTPPSVAIWVEPWTSPRMEVNAASRSASFFFFFVISTRIYTKVHDEGVHPRVETRLDCSTSGPPQPSSSLRYSKYICPRFRHFSDLSLAASSHFLRSPPSPLSAVPPSPPPLPPGFSRISLLPHRTLYRPTPVPIGSFCPPRTRTLVGVLRSVPPRTRTGGLPLSLSRTASRSASSLPGIPIWQRIQAMAVSSPALPLRAFLISTSIPERGGDPLLRFSVELNGACESVRMKFMPPCAMHASPIAALSASAAAPQLPNYFPALSSSCLSSLLLLLSLLFCPSYLYIGPSSLGPGGLRWCLPGTRCVSTSRLVVAWGGCAWWALGPVGRALPMCLSQLFCRPLFVLIQV